MRTRVLRSGWTSIISGVLALTSFMIMWLGYPETYHPAFYEATGPGVVIFFDSSRRELLHETDAGYIKLLSPLCQTQLPVWSHMRANITFVWKPFRGTHQGRGPDAGEECYYIYSVHQMRPDKEHP